MPTCTSSQRLSKFALRKLKPTAPISPKTSTDIVFKVDGKVQKFPKDTLCQASPVFKAMLEGNFATSKGGCKITDVSAPGFALFLKGVKWIQEHKKKRLSIGETDISLNLKCILQALYVAHKYQALEVETLFTSTLSREVHWSNALTILQHAEVLGNIYVESKCWSIIESFATQVVQTEEFRRIPWTLLCRILENSRLQVGEFLLMKHVYLWCATDLLTKEKNNNMKTVREVLGVAVYKIRFPLMTYGEFDQAKLHNLLALGEITDLESNFRRNTTFNNSSRRNICQCRKSGGKCRLCVCNGEYSSIRPNLFRGKVSEGVEMDCECKKYKSCPNYPNGTTAKILLGIMTN